MFFENEIRVKILASFIQKANIATVKEEFRATRLSISKEIIGYIHKSPSDWDARCSFNIKNIGEQYINWLNDFDPSKSTDIDNIYSMSYRFLCEFDFLAGSGQELSRELRHIRNKIEHDTHEIDGEVKSEIIYASYIMPANIVKDFINDANIGAFKAFEEKKLEAEKLKLDWDKEIASKEKTVQDLKDKLEKYKIGFNFVGLYQGFADLAEKKCREAFWLFWALIGMGILILTPLFIEITLLIIGSINSKPLGIDQFLILVPIISIEVILIYFFRVILSNHRSVKAQIMQIELRQTLCQFIQSYTSYASDMKKQDSTALEKFENLIFSGVISDPEKLPSTFDGMEQVGNLIKNLKNS